MSKASILVIDDEKDLLKLLRYNLESEGYTVFTASDGESGVEIAMSGRPDAILLDLMLPSIDGLEVCRILKRSRQTRHIPVLLLTAKSAEADQVVGLELGATDYLTKPFSVKVLLARLKKALANRAARDERGVLFSGDFILDRERARFEAGGKPVLLTKTEFGILALLMQRPGAVVTRASVVSEVWGSGAHITDAALNMHLKGLRKKLGPRRGRVETVRGLGYRLAEAVA